jgi:hypothetical protein
MNTDDTIEASSTELENGLTRVALGDPVETVDYGDKEILRVYATELKVVGQPGVSILIETPLRYDAAGAKRRPADSPEAKREAFKRAEKLERASNHTADDTVFEMGEVTLLRTRVVAPRVPKKAAPKTGPEIDRLRAITEALEAADALDIAAALAAREA